MAKMLAIKDIVDDLGVHEETVRLWIRQGKLVAYKIGRDWKIRPADYQRFLDERRSTDTENDQQDTD